MTAVEPRGTDVVSGTPEPLDVGPLDAKPLDVPMDRWSRRDAADRWTADIFAVAQPAGAVVTLDVDMSEAMAFLRRQKLEGAATTYTTLLVKAAGLALASQPQLHQVVGARRRLLPGRVDIGLSVAGESPCAPVMVIEDAARKPVAELGEEIRTRAPQVREKERRDLQQLRRWGRLVPTSRLRRAVLRTALRRAAFRRSIAGTFQVSNLPLLDSVVPLAFVATGVLASGAVRDRVVVIDGAPAVRPTVTLCCSFNHTVWDAVRAAQFLGVVKLVLESEDAHRLVSGGAEASRR